MEDEQAWRLEIHCVKYTRRAVAAAAELFRAGTSLINHDV